MANKITILRQIRKGKALVNRKHRYGFSVSSLHTKETPSFAVKLMTEAEIKAFHKPGLCIAGVLDQKADADAAKLLQVVAQHKAKLSSGAKIITLAPKRNRFVVKRFAIKEEQQQGLRQPLGPRRGGFNRLSLIDPTVVSGIDATGFFASIEQSGMKIERVTPEFFEAAGGRDADGRYYVIITTDTEEMPEYRTVHVVRNPKKKKEALKIIKKKRAVQKEPQKILCEGLDDKLIIEALEAAGKKMLDGEKSRMMTWKEEGVSHNKSFGYFHLMVCLFYYLCVNKLLADESGILYWLLPYFRYCENLLPDEKKNEIHSIRYFRKVLTNLQVGNRTFKKYIDSKGEPQVITTTGEVPMNFWYAIYCEAAPSFGSVLMK